MNTMKLVILGAAGIALAVYFTRPAKQTPQFAAGGPPPTGSTGGTLATLGAWLGAGGQLLSAFDPTSTGTDRSTPVYNSSTLWNPVSSSPAVLPYSYKQATIDVPSLLQSDDLFTPSDGSSGAYSDDEYAGTGAGPTANSYWV